MTHSSKSTSYAELLARISALSQSVQSLLPAPDGAPPLVGFRAGKVSDSSAERVLLSAGIHGDEPAGVLGLIEFLEQDLQRYSHDFSFYVLPCLNPSGFERSTRVNAAGVDLNRVFSAPSPHYEVSAVLTALAAQGERYVATLDLHEDSPEITSDLSPADAVPDGYYLYECARHSSLRISAAVLHQPYDCLRNSDSVESSGARARSTEKYLRRA